MDIYVNGSKAAIVTEGRTLGQVLAELDERAEAGGGVIVALGLDGKNIEPDAIEGLSGMDAGGPGRLDLEADSAAAMKARAIETLMELMTAVSAATDPAGIEASRTTLGSFRSAFGGLFSAEEESFLGALDSALSDAGGQGAEPVSVVVERLRTVFTERLSELRDPVSAMRAAQRTFEALKPEIGEVPVRMQTGKDAEAMRTMILVVELINKTVRTLPEFTRAVAGGASMSMGGRGIDDFYEDFNGVLTELAGAFQGRDSVLIGDLAEYEILPRLVSFFEAVDRAAGAS